MRKSHYTERTMSTQEPRRLDVTPPRAPLLPRELFFLLPVIPAAATLVLVDDLFESDALTVLRKLAAIAIPFGADIVALGISYLLIFPRVLPRLQRPSVRIVVEVVGVAVFAAALSELVRPLHNRICGVDFGSLRFILSGLTIMATVVVPARLFQAQRVRALAVERLAMLERQEALRAQLQALQARTNPHFFFNSLNTVASLIVEDPQLAERTLERLADLFRYALDSARTPLVPLSRELDIIRDYLAIQEARFGDRLRVSVSCDPTVATVEVPPLLLQPVVENAILHGLKDRSGGRVDVRAWRDGDRVVIDVTDDGPGPGRSAHTGTATSVKDLGARLRLLFGDAAAFILEPLPEGGSLARVKLPLPVISTPLASAEQST
jgi:two-component system, LytTR family, sensor histidine kinase AlgZ